MALTNNNLEMIKAVAHNDIYAARKAALASLAEDKTKKNDWAVNYYRKMLTGNASVLMSNLPSNIQTFLVGEAPGHFDISKYYLRPSEAKVADDIYRMKLVADEMAERGIPYRNTTLLYGQSGTGKTELGKYIGYKLNLPFFYISFANTIDSYMSGTAKNIRKVFDFCNSIPCVLMLDEIDCIATTRTLNGSKGVDGEIERTTISIMQEFDRLPNHVILIGGTNRPDIVDEALMRRFSIKHEIQNMTAEELDSMIRQYVFATNTEKYIREEDISNLTVTYQNPGQVMPELIRIIGENIFEDKKDELLEKAAFENDDKLDLFEVTYTWKSTVSAETEEDAIAIGRSQRNSYSSKSYSSEMYTAKRAEFLSSTQENK